jgi:hypothetical protein
MWQGKSSLCELNTRHPDHRKHYSPMLYSWNNAGIPTLTLIHSYLLFSHYLHYTLSFHHILYHLSFTLVKHYSHLTFKSKHHFTLTHLPIHSYTSLPFTPLLSITPFHIIDLLLLLPNYYNQLISIDSYTLLPFISWYDNSLQINTHELPIDYLPLFIHDHLLPIHPGRNQKTSTQRLSFRCFQVLHDPTRIEYLLCMHFK